MFLVLIRVTLHFASYHFLLNVEKGKASFGKLNVKQDWTQSAKFGAQHTCKTTSMLGIRQQMFGSELLDVDTINIGFIVRSDSFYCVLLGVCGSFQEWFLLVFNS